MENCLVTQLKGTVENDNLSYFGKIGLKVTDTNAHPITFGIKAGDRIYFMSSQSWSVNGTTQSENVFTAPSNGDYIVSASGTWLVLVDKYNLTKIYNSTATGTVEYKFFDDLAGCPDFNYILVASATTTNNVEGNIESIKGNIIKLGIRGSQKLSGNIDNLSYDKNCEDLDFGNCPLIHGNVESVFVKLYNAGRTTNHTIICGGAGSNVKWHNANTSTYTAVFGEGQISVYVLSVTPEHLRGTWTPGGGWVYTT